MRYAVVSGRTVVAFHSACQATISGATGYLGHTKVITPLQMTSDVSGLPLACRASLFGCSCRPLPDGLMLLGRGMGAIPTLLIEADKLHSVINSRMP
jgi:hypothetical protein